MKVSERKNASLDAQNNLQYLHKDAKKDNTKVTNTFFLIHTNQLPKNKKPTYLRICVNFWPQKEDPYCVQFTVGGNLTNSQG